ncbi:MAG TPA: hypothetical protein VFH36_01050 [Acidimicrobiales bacterium]|nr:hypothetical protein [Acidimicrobiales bacterium]
MPTSPDPRPWRPVRRAATVVVAVAALAVALGVGGAPAAASAPPADEAAAQRVLLISVPGLTWAEVRDHDLPAIEGLLAESAVAAMAPRGVLPRSTPGAAYLTISAGARATSDPLVDGQQLALGEQAGGSSAGEIFERRTGVEPDGNYVALAWPTLVRVNASKPYDAVLGLLTDTLAEAGMGAEAIGNADGTDTVGTSYERQVGLAAATSDGVIPAGELDSDLLVRDPSRAFGQRLDLDRVTQRFQAAWRAPAGRDGGLVVVEASDLARSMRYRDRVDSARYEQLRSQALRDTDDLVARLLAEVDPERDAVLLVAPYNLPTDRDLVVSALRTPGSRPGYLRSASTQRSGFLTLVDVAPTVLDALGVDRPVEMEGRPAEVVASGDSLGARVDRLVTLNEASRFREQLLFPTTLAVVVVLGLVCAAAMGVLARRTSARVARTVGFVALAAVSVLPLSFLARGFPLEDLGAGFYWAFVIVGAVLVVGALSALARRLGRSRLALVAVLALVLAVPVGDVMTGSQLSLSAAFGYSPTGNSRLYGISNYSFGMVAAASCLLAAFIADRWRSGRGRVAAIGLLVAVLVVIGMPVFGSDVGGIIAFTPTILVFAALVSGYRLRLRTVVVGLVATTAAVVAFGLLDLARPPGQRAHLGRLFERIGNEGLGPLLSIVERKLLANLAVTTSSFWVAVIPIAVAFIVFLARYPTRPLTRLYELVPTLRAGVLSAIVAAVLGSAVNDSGLTVGGVTMFVTVAALAWLALDTVAPLPAAAGRRGRADGREQGGGHGEADEPDGAGGPSGDDRPIAAADGSPPPAGTPGATPAGAPSPSSPSAAPPARAGADPA